MSLPLPRLLMAEQAEEDWLFANVPNVTVTRFGRFRYLVVPDYDTVDDLLYNEIRSSGAEFKLEKNAFFRVLRMRLSLAKTIHEPSHESMSMNGHVYEETTYNFSPGHIPDEWAFEDVEDL